MSQQFIPLVLSFNDQEVLVNDAFTRATGVGQPEYAARLARIRAADAAASALTLNGTSLGASPAISMNPLQLDGMPKGNAQQSDVRNPAPNPPGITTQRNPMGL